MIRRGGAPIHLDTSFLIRALDPSSSEWGALREWLKARRPLALSTLAWGEFLCGPLDPDDVPIARRLVRRQVPIGAPEAEEAARLFNASGRRKGSLGDCIIAATALLDGGVLATSDRGDFGRLAGEGLELM